jgi:transcriptional regulator with XRE-family HTH domain
MKPNISYPSVAETALGQRLKAWREYRGFTQAEVERRGGLAHNALSRIETGGVSPKLGTLERIAAALELSVEELHLRMPPGAPNTAAESPGIYQLKQLIEDLPPEKQAGVIAAMCRLIEQVKS